MVNLAYQLPAFPSEGKWTIRVEAMSQVQDYTVYVERYYVPFFEVCYAIIVSFDRLIECFDFLLRLFRPGQLMF